MSLGGEVMGKMTKDNYIYIIYKKMFMEKCLILNWKVNLRCGWRQLIRLLAKVEVNPDIQFQYVLGRRRWLVKLIMSKLSFKKREILNLTTKYIKWQVTLWTYRGIRHLAHLPIYGQRTRSNARTVRRK